MAEPRRFEDNATPAVRSDLSTAVVDGELLVFDPVHSQVHQLDRIGALVWQFLDGSATVGELTADLADAFSMPPEQIRADLTRLLEELDETGLLAGSAPPAPATALGKPQGPVYLVDPPAP